MKFSSLLRSRRREWRLAAGAASLCIATALRAQDSTVIVAGRLLDPATGTTVRGQQILVVGGRIAQVAATVTHSAASRVIDLSQFTVLPGLIDAHVHLIIGGTPRNNALADLRAG